MNIFAASMLYAGMAHSAPGWSISTVQASCSLLCLVAGIALLVIAAYVITKAPSEFKRLSRRP